MLKIQSFWEVTTYRWITSDVSTTIVPSLSRRLLGLIDAKDEGTIILRKDRNCTVNDTVSHLRRTESSLSSVYKTVHYPVVL